MDKLKTIFIFFFIMLLLRTIFIYHNNYNTIKTSENELYASLVRLMHEIYTHEYGTEITIEGYESVILNGKIWMKENLNTTHYQNGDPIIEIKETKNWQTAKTGAWCNYNNDPEFGKVYGKLYNWYAVNDPRGLCPNGWRVASMEDWMELVEFYGGKYLSVIAFRSENGWSSKGGKNYSRLTILPGGYRPTPDTSENGNDFDGLTGAVYWTSNPSKSSSILFNKTALGIDVGPTYVFFANNTWYVGKSVRCIRG